MKYIFSKLNNSIRLIGEINDAAEIITQETYPAQEYREGNEAILDYNENDGVHWEYIPVPTEAAGIGKEWVLDKVDGVWQYVIHDRPLTDAERLDIVEDEIAQQKYPWKANEAVNGGDRRYYNGKWYRCIQAHTTQADWMPDIVPALWGEE